jgi:predicted dehydrogenase
MDKIRAAVVGVGHLGQHHARILASTAGVELVGVADVDVERARAIASLYGGVAFGDARDLLGRADAVTIAVPTASHLEVALPFLERRVAVLIEKPLAASLAEADRIIEAAARHGALLATGHTERFNPAVTAAMPLIKDPRFIEVHRLGVFPERSLDIDVVFDVMIHDLDLLLALVGSEVTSVEAVGVAVLTPKVDIANVRLRFASGCIANLTASRISRDRVRKIRFFQHDAYVSVDYAARDVEVYRLVQQNGGRPSIQGGRVELTDGEPLRFELEDFVAAIREGRPPLVTGRAGRDALALATAVTEQMQQGT